MSRYIFQDTAVDGKGNRLTSATVNIYEAGTITAVDVYTASSGGSAVNSVTTDSTNGTFSFYVDTGDYASTQKFKISISKPIYITITIDDIKIFPASSSEIRLENVSGKYLKDLFDGGYDVPIKPSKIFGGGNNTNGHTIPNVSDDTFTVIGASQTLTNKTLTSPVINTPTGDVVTKTDTQTLTNKTLTAPTVASFTNAQHPHIDAASGGLLTYVGDPIVKGWAMFDGDSFAQKDDYNVSNIADNGPGDYTISWGTDFATAFYVKVASSGAAQTQVKNLATGTSDINLSDSGGTPTDSAVVTCIAIGDQ